jgi:hypothetical protein
MATVRCNHDIDVRTLFTLSRTPASELIHPASSLMARSFHLIVLLQHLLNQMPIFLFVTMSSATTLEMLHLMGAFTPSVDFFVGFIGMGHDYFLPP